MWIYTANIYCACKQKLRINYEHVIKLSISDELDIIIWM